MRILCLAMAALALLCLCGVAQANYSNGFETNNAGWDYSYSYYHAARVASGTHGIASASGGYHAESSQWVSGGALYGSVTNWGGYNYGVGGGVPTTFKEYTTSVDIYLNMEGGWANDTRFDWSGAVNGADGNHKRDFIFNGGFYNDSDATGTGNRFVFSASNNSQRSSAYAKNPGRGPVTISTTGWYTFQHHFYNNGGVLAVDLSILDSSGATIKSWTLSDGGDLIATVGGNRYGYFTCQEFSVMAIDNAWMTVVPEPCSMIVLLGGLGSVLAIRRRRA